VTLLLTTHVLEIAERLATHAGVIRGGRMLDQGTVQSLRERYDAPSLEAVFEKLISVPAARNAKLSFYGEAPPADVVALRRGSA
jgi:ABC-2 type transport system ATP-binding protein